MSRILDRVWALIRAAVNSEAAEDDASAAALEACTLIVSENLELSDPRANERQTGERELGRVIRARFDATCRICGVLIRAGEPCWWRRGRGVAHWGCTQEAA